MKKALFLAATFAVSSALAFSQAPAPKAAPATKADAAKPARLTPEQVHRSALVVDTHEDTPQRFVDEHWDIADPIGTGQISLDAIHKGNLGASFMSIWVDPELYQGHFARRTLELIDASRQQAAKHSDQIKFATSTADIEAARRQHKYAMLMGIEGGHSIEDSLGLLRDYYALGVRYMTLTWSNSNNWADSSGDYTDTSVPHTQSGLSEFGKDVVYEMNRLGMMVDISHVADKTFFRTLVITRAPVIASHSSARALCDAPRNMTDDMLRAVAINGGVVMVNFYSGFLSQDYRNAQLAQAPQVKAAKDAFIAKAKAEGKQVVYADLEKIDAEWTAKIPRPPMSVLIDHIDHIAKVAGIDHVGLGSDFDGVSGDLPEGINSAADLPKITAALMARGYSAEDCRKILGGNFMRVFREVEAVAKDLQSAERPKITDKQPFDKPAK